MPIITKNKKLDKRRKVTKVVDRWFNKYTRASAVAGLIFGSLLGCYFGSLISNTKNGSPEAFKQSLEVKEIIAQEPYCDFNALTYIRCRGHQLGYDDFTISKFVRIGRAESSLNPLAKNPKSTATGIYQFINGTFHRYCKGKNVYDFKDNIDCFYKVLEVDGYPKGLNHWNASRSKWDI